MICENIPADTKVAASPVRKRSYASTAIRIVCFICASTLLIVVLLLSLGMMRLSQGGVHILAAFIYSAMIAIPSMFVLNWIGTRYSERFPRLVVLMYAAAQVCTAIAGSLAAVLILQTIGIIPSGRYWIELQFSLPFAVVMSVMIGLSIATYEKLRYRLQAAKLELRTRQLEQERAYKLLAEAQLSSLESRLHPHFLFNTLNSIAALIPRDPQLAEDTVGKLASLLRFSLNANRSGLVPLGQEIKIVRDYLEIEKTRFGQRLRYEINVPSVLNDIKVPPLCLQSLVENSVKHVVSQRQQGTEIQIAASRDGNRLRLEVIDDGPGFSLDSITPEHGLGNLIGRLELLFGASGQIEVTRQSEKTIVRLTFPS
jgi:sensor histidine kinase YesM